MTLRLLEIAIYNFSLATYVMIKFSLATYVMIKFSLAMYVMIKLTHIKLAIAKNFTYALYVLSMFREFL